MASKNETNKGDYKGGLISKEWSELIMASIMAKTKEESKELFLEFENRLRNTSKKEIKGVVQFIDGVKENITLERLYEAEQTLIDELKSLASKAKKFDHKRKPGELPKPRKRSTPKQDAFHKWVKDNKIDTRLTLDHLTLDVEDAHQSGKIKIKIGRSTVQECLKAYRKK